VTKLRLSFSHNMWPIWSRYCGEESPQSKENSYVTKRQGKNTKSRKIWCSTNIKYFSFFCVTFKQHQQQSFLRQPWL